MKNAWISLGAVCALVIGVYACLARSDEWESLSPNAADSSYYNLLVQGFRAGQLSLKEDVPTGFTRLADPYNPSANEPYREPYRSGSARLHDLSYYKGRLYLYFGVTPALILFWPFVALTGHYLSHRLAVLIFCTIGFLASVGVLCATWRRYFSDVSVGVVAAGALALGLATGLTVMLPRSAFYEVAISCGYMLTMLALGTIWGALHKTERQCWWLAAASAACGLAVGARPSLLFGAVILLAPVVQAWRERRKIWALLMAATGPIMLIGLGLMLYNLLRFDSPFEFGIRYQLSGIRQDTAQRFHLGYLWFNFRVYFLEPARWSGHFPFVHEITVPPLPAGHVEEVQHASSILINIPLVWLALATPLAWRRRSAEARSVLRGFFGAVAMLFGTCALTIALFCTTAQRYEVEFLPALVLLAVISILSLERALISQAVWRRAARWGWSALLSLSVAFNLFASVGHYAEAQYNLGLVLFQLGKVPEAIGHYEQALRIKADYAEAHNNLGVALMRQGRLQEAISHYEQALRIKPDSTEAHFNLGLVLVRLGKVPEAIGHYEQALRIKADYVDAHINLGVALMGQGRLQEAISHYEQAVRLRPDSAEAHYNFGSALFQAGKMQEAAGQYEQALRIKPGFTEAHRGLGLALVQLGRTQEAIEHWQQALQINPDLAETHYNLGVALEKLGRTTEAVQHYQQALRIRPGFVEAQNALARARAAQ